jgi:hypothetical protein
MKIEPVSGGRATIRDTGRLLEVIIPARRRIFLAIVLVLWLCGWAVGESMVLRQVISARTLRVPPAFLFAWLALWTLGGAFALFTLVWTMFGRERVTVTEQYLDLRREALMFGRGRRYDLSNVKDLRVRPAQSATVWLAGGGQFQSFGGGLIAFDYGARTVRFGASLDEAEAKQIVAQLTARSAWHRRSNPAR